MVGAAAAKILLDAGATRATNAEGDDLIKASIRLPTGTFDYVCQWEKDGPYDADKNIRNNMLGADHAELILKIDVAVDEFLESDKDPNQRALALKVLMKKFPNAERSALEQEFDLTAAAPISAHFPPPPNTIPLLSRKG